VTVTFTFQTEIAFLSFSLSFFVLVKKMTDKLPPNLLKLFAPRPPLPYYPPLDKDPSKHVGCRVTGIASYVPMLKDHDPDYVPWKSLAEKRKEKVLSL
jgi:U1 small nuclear ribonucleoprotein